MFLQLQALLENSNNPVDGGVMFAYNPINTISNIWWKTSIMDHQKYISSIRWYLQKAREWNIDHKTDKNQNEKMNRNKMYNCEKRRRKMI